MVKFRIMLVALCCVVFGYNAAAQDLKSLLGGIANSVIGDKATTAETIVGSWRFTGPDCRFNSDNLLMQAGGEMASQKVEQTLSSVYDKLGLDGSSFEFDSDGSYSFSFTPLNSKPLSTSGTYTFDSTDKTVTMKTKMGVTMTANVIVTGSTMSLLFNADKLLTVLQGLTDLVSQVNSSASVFDSLVGNYDGIQLGFELEKQ